MHRRSAEQLNVDTLIVDREVRIGDNWRKRYRALTLHNQVQVNHLPYMHFPPNWPTYIPKDKLANWFEAYVEALELNFSTETEFQGGAYDETQGCWTVTLGRADGSQRTMHPRHVVLATGYKRQEELVGKLFGEAVERRVGTIWGFGEEQELRNMYTRTRQPGLWFIVGGLAQCRIGSKHLALQIKAIEEGLLPRDMGPKAEFS